MRLTRYTDFSLRVLLYLGTRPGRVCAVPEIARAYGVSQNHLMKVVQDLGRRGYVTSVRGRFGGIRLARPAEAINVGAVVRQTEDDFDLVECGTCLIAPACGLSSALGEAMGAFMAVLDRYTLADLLAERMAGLAALLGIGDGEAVVPGARRVPVSPAPAVTAEAPDLARPAVPPAPNRDRT